MKLERIKQLAGLNEDVPQGVMDDLLEFRAYCAARPEEPMKCGEFVKMLDKIIRKHYGKFTDI